MKNLHITHVVSGTTNCPETLCYLRLRLIDDSQQDPVEVLPLPSQFISLALKAEAGVESWSTAAWRRVAAQR